MKTLFSIFCIMSAAMLASCDLRSGIAKENMEKFNPTPTPPFSPTPTPIPIDPADIVGVDINQEGDVLSVTGYDQKKTINCTKFNRVRVNGDMNLASIKGVCREIMINGDKNEITVDAAMEFVFNGTENRVKYSRFLNGKQPLLTQNRPGNIIEKVEVETTSGQSRNKPL